jgi:hypothetical protein
LGVFAGYFAQPFDVTEHFRAGKQVLKFLVAFRKLFELAPDGWSHGGPDGAQRRE